MLLVLIVRTRYSNQGHEAALILESCPVVNRPNIGALVRQIRFGVYSDMSIMGIVKGVVQVKVQTCVCIYIYI